MYAAASTPNVLILIPLALNPTTRSLDCLLPIRIADLSMLAVFCVAWCWYWALTNQSRLLTRPKLSLLSMLFLQLSESGMFHAKLRSCKVDGVLTNRAFCSIRRYHHIQANQCRMGQQHIHWLVRSCYLGDSE